MRTISLVLAAAALTFTSALAAGPGGKTLENPPPTVTLLFSVPYSFSGVHKDLQYAVIRCVAMVGSKTPPIGTGETIVHLNGQPASGTANVTVQASPGKKLYEAKYYSCGMQVSDGKMKITPQFGPGPAWSRAQQGSTFLASREIK